MPKLNLQLKISRYFLGLFLLVWLGSFAIIFSQAFSWGLTIFLTLLTLGYGLKILWQYVLLKNTIIGLRYHHVEGWKIQLRDEVFAAKLLGESTVSKWVSVLRFKVEEKYFKCSCVVWSDSLTSEEYRRLRVVARWMLD